MATTSKRHISEFPSERTESKKRTKIGASNANIALQSSSSMKNDAVAKPVCGPVETPPTSTDDCDSCTVQPNCALACNVSCDGSDDCTAPEACNDPLCEGDPCWEDECDKFECTDQSCRANQCRIEPCSQEKCLEEGLPFSIDNCTSGSNLCWDAHQNFQHVATESELSNAFYAGYGSPIYSNNSSSIWQNFQTSNEFFPLHAAQYKPTVDTSYPPVAYTSINQNNVSQDTVAGHEPLYTTEDINNLLATTSVSNTHQHNYNNNSIHNFESNKERIAHNYPNNSNSNACNLSWTNHEANGEYKTIPRQSISSLNRLSISTDLSSPLDMIAAAAELSAGIDFPYPYEQENCDNRIDQFHAQPTSIHNNESHLTSHESNQTAINEGKFCFCKWKSNDSGVKLCNKRFESEEALWIHVKWDHTSNLTNKYVCQWHGCARPGQFGTKSKLERHLLPHTGYKEHKCPICNAAFSLKQQVENHVRIHTGDTPYKCDECGQTFRTAQARDDHKRRHKGVRQFKCRVCGLACTDASNRSKHERTHRLEAYECRHEGCTAKAKRWDNIKRHFEHMGHCLDILHDPKEQQRYKRSAEAASKCENLGF